MIAENAKDPYSVAVKNDDLMDVLPLVEFGDLYYLITSPSPFTKDELKVGKIMDCRNCLLSGWVGSVSGCPATADCLAEDGRGNEDETFASC